MSTDRRDLPRPQGVLVDLGETTLHQDWYEPGVGIARLFELAHHADVFDFDAAKHAALELESEMRRAREAQTQTGLVEFRFQSFLRLLLERFELRTDLAAAELELEFWKAASRMMPEPGVATALDELAARKIPVAIVSNSVFSGDVLRWELARNGLAERFQFVMSSADYGFRKPHPSLFLTAVAKLRLQPPEVWFVGDSLENDVRGASATGLTPFWYRGRPSWNGGVCSYRTLDDWNDFVALLSGLP